MRIKAPKLTGHFRRMKKQHRRAQARIQSRPPHGMTGPRKRRASWH